MQVAKKLLCDATNLDTFIESPTSTGMKLTLKVSDPNQLIIGLRILVGHSGISYLPSQLHLGSRVVPLSPGLRRWYQLSLTSSEALKYQQVGLKPLFLGGWVGGWV